MISVQLTFGKDEEIDQRGEKEIKGIIRRRNRRIRGEWTSEAQILLQEKQQNIFRRLGWAGHMVIMEEQTIPKEF